MKILMISDVYYPRVNGVSTSIATFRQGLLELGHEVCLIAPAYPQSIDDDPDILRIASRYLWLDPEDRMMKGAAIRALEKQLRGRRFDVVHIQTPFVAHHAGLQLARRLGVPAVETYHTYFEEYLYHYVALLPRGMMRAAARYFTRSQCNRLDAVIVPSTAMRQVITEYGVSSPVTILPTGLDQRQFHGGSRDRFRVQHGIAPERPVLVHVGRVAHEKNIDFLLDVVSRLRYQLDDVLLVIAGEGPARKALHARVGREGLQDNVLFVNYLPRGTPLWDCYCAGDLFVFASATETQGLVLLEALALGVPVVSTAVLGTRDIVLAQRGCRVAAAEVQDFTHQVLHLLRDSAERNRLAQQARAYAVEWSAANQARRLIEFYAGLADAADAGKVKARDPVTAGP